MQRVKFSLACLVCLLMLTPARAQSTAVETDLGVATLEDYSGGVSYGGAYFDVRTQTGDGVGYRNGYTQLGVLYPIWVTPDMYIAPHARLLLTDNSQIGVNAGGLWRSYSMERDRIFGAYAYYDDDHSAEGFSYQQVALGVETLGQFLDARLNGYFAADSGENFLGAVSISDDPIFFANRLGFVGQAVFQEAVSGADFEFGAPLSRSTPWLRGFAGAYFYDAVENDPIGFRGRIDANISDDLLIGVQVTHDNNYGTNVNALVDFRFAGWKPTRYFPQWTVRERMMAPVQRNWRVATADTEQDVLVAAKNPATGQPYFVVHIDASNANPGDGTFENPFNFLPANAPGADLILVQRDGTSLANPLTGSITLEDNQRFLGEGKAHQADVLVMFGNIMYTDTITLPGFVDDGNFPFLSSAGNIVTLANNNEVSAFNFVNAGGFAVTNTVAGSNNFNLNCLNITGNGGGIFLQNATGTGILRDINALNNLAGGISIESGNTALNLTGTRIVSSSLPAGVQPFGMQLIANPGTINATLTDIELNRNTDGLILTGTNGDLNVTITDASIDDSTNDGIRITGNNSDVALNVSATTVNRSGGEGLEADMLGGSLAILGRNVTINNSAADNVNLDMVNTTMSIDFRNATFNNDTMLFATTGSGFVLANTGGAGGGTLVLENVTATGNALDGLNISGDNFTQINADIRNGIFSNNGRDAFSVSATNNAVVNVDFRALVATNSGRHGLNFTSSGDADLSLDLLGVNLNNSGQTDPVGNGVNGVANDGDVELVMQTTTAANSANNGMAILAQNDAQVAISVNTGSFRDSGQNGLGTGDAVNLITETGADLIIQLNNTPMDNSVAVPGGTQDDGFVVDASTNSTILANISNSSLANNLSNAIQANVDTNASVAVNLLNVTATGSGQDGILFDVQTGGQFALNSQSSSFDNSGASGTGDGVDGFVRSGGDVTMVWQATTVRNSAENGFRLDIAEAGSSFDASISGGDFSDSGDAQLGLGQQDAFNVTVASDASATFNLNNTPSRNNQTPPAGTQQRGLAAVVTTGGDLVFNNASGDMSDNLINAINLVASGAGTTVNLALLNTDATGSGQDGFLFNVSDQATLNASFDNSSLSNSGVLGATDLDFFDGVDGTLDTQAVVVLNFVDSAIQNAYHDAVRIDASNFSSFEATFDNSPLDNAGLAAVFNGTENGGDALRLTFDTGATANADTDGDGFAGITLINGSTATNAGDDAIFLSTADAGTDVVVNAINSDLSDSGTNASTDGGNGIRTIVTTDSSATFNVRDTAITNTAGRSPQQRGVLFDVTAGGQLDINLVNSDLSNHSLEGINGSVDGVGILESTANILVANTPVDNNGTFGALFNVTNQGDLTLTTVATTSFSNNDAGGIFANVNGAGSTFTMDLAGTTIDNNGLVLGGNGVTITADNGAAVFGAMTSTSISGNSNVGLLLTLDNASSADFGVTTAGLVDTVIDNNGNEGINALVAGASELDFSMTNGTTGSSVSGNGTLGTAGDLTDSYDNVRVEAQGGSDVEVQFVQTTADGSTRNGFNFIAQDSIFLAQLRAGTSASGNTGGSGVRFVADGATTQAVLFMSDTSADGLLTGTNAFDNNGTASLNTPTDPNDGFPQTGSGVFFSATNVDIAAVGFSGSASGNGNPADPNRDIDGDGDGDDDGLYINIDGANQAAVEIVTTGAISNNVDQAIDLNLANITLLDTVTQPSELTPPSVVIGATGPGILIEGVTADNNGGGINVTLTNMDLNGNDIIFRNNTVTNNDTTHGIALITDTVTNVDELIFDTNTVTGNGLDGVHLNFTDSDFASVLFDSNTISGNGVALTDGDGVGFDVVDNTAIGPVTFTNNTISNNEFDGVSIDGVAPTTGLWDLTFDSNVAIDGNDGYGININVPNAAADVNLVMTDNASISGNELGGVRIALNENNTLTATSVYGNSVNNNRGPGLLVTANNGSTVTLTLGDAAQAANQFNGNTDAGAALLMAGTSTGALNVTNSTFNNTTNGANPNLNGDGFRIDLANNAELTTLNIDGNSTANPSVQFNGNAGDGFSLELGEQSIVSAMTIDQVQSSNNGGDGVEITRFADSLLDNITISNSTINNNSQNGIVLDLQGGAVDITTLGPLVIDATIANNTIGAAGLGNDLNGILFNVDADARLEADVLGNSIVESGNSGIRANVLLDGQVDGVWNGNTIQQSGRLNGPQSDGINITTSTRALVGTASGLTISNNTISNSTRDGIRIESTGNSAVIAAISDQQPLFLGDTRGIINNGGNGINILSGGAAFIGVDSDRNLISNNGLNGINVSTEGLAATVLDSTQDVVQFNSQNGVNISTTGFGQASVTLTDDRIVRNTQRGVSLVNQGDADTDLTIQASNVINPVANIGTDALSRIEQNGQVGVYIENNAGALNTSNNVVFNISNTAVVGNGTNTGVSADNRNGIWIRAGTSSAGSIAATVDNNFLSGNGNIDFVTQSFTATPTPGVASPYTNAGAVDVDPVARLGMIFQNNAGDQVDVTRFGATYNNGDSFKSPGAFFDSNTRLRNAQRLALDFPGTGNNGPFPVNDTVQGSTAPTTTAFAGSGVGEGAQPNQTFVNLGLTISGQTRDITAYNNGTNLFTVGSALGAAPAVGTNFTVFARDISGVGRSTFRTLFATIDNTAGGGNNSFTNILSNLNDQVILGLAPDNQPLFGNSQTFTWSQDLTPFTFEP